MAKKVLILSSSLRPDSNSEQLAREAGRGALEARNDVEVLSLAGRDIRLCCCFCTVQVQFACTYSSAKFRITSLFRFAITVFICRSKVSVCCNLWKSVIR